MLANDFGFDYSPFQVHSRREIVALLRALQEHGQLVSLLINGGSEAVVTSILDVDSVNDLVVVDSSPDKDLNDRIVKSESVSFETFLERIRILFFSEDVSPCMHDDLPALCFPIPLSLVRLQRREFYRVATPVANPVRCVITPLDEQGAPLEPVSTYLQNISAGGVALVDEKKALDNTIGLVYKNCRLDLPGGSVTTSLQVRSSQELTFNGRALRRLGCMFVDIPQPMLAMVQRYITKLEREQNARSTGLR